MIITLGFCCASTSTFESNAMVNRHILFMIQLFNFSLQKVASKKQQLLAYSEISLYYFAENLGSTNFHSFIWK
jgi:hypothetical protein